MSTELVKKLEGQKRTIRGTEIAVEQEIRNDSGSLVIVSKVGSLVRESPLVPAA